MIKMNGFDWHYEGETDLDGNAAGWGAATDVKYKYSGLFLDNKVEGTIIRTDSGGDTFVFESHSGFMHGRGTHYGFRIINKVHGNGVLVSEEDVTDTPEKAYYTKSGKPLCAPLKQD